MKTLKGLLLSGAVVVGALASSLSFSQSTVLPDGSVVSNAELQHDLYLKLALLQRGETQKVQLKVFDAFENRHRCLTDKADEDYSTQKLAWDHCVTAETDAVKYDRQSWLFAGANKGLVMNTLVVYRLVHKDDKLFYRFFAGS